MKFYLGTHEPHWLARVDVPLFVSARRLRRLSRVPRSAVPWALDSGGFSELSLHGRWEAPPEDYAREVMRWSDEVGRLEWAAPQDWMCEPTIRKETGLSVEEHQRRTVDSVIQLRSLVRGVPIIPVVQGWTVPDYIRCVELYDRAGIDLRAEPVVGLGTVCRRQSTGQGVEIVRRVRGLGILGLHGFGIKRQGLAQIGHLLGSADSMAWSLAARKRPPLPGCTHANCANCMRWALKWRAETLCGAGRQHQLDMWEPV